MASKSLGTLTIDLVAKTGGFEQGMDRASRTAKRRAGEIQSDLKALERWTDQWARRIALGATAAAAAFSTWTLSVSKSMDATLKMAQQIGTTTETLTGLRYAVQQFSNVSDQTFDMSLRRMTRRIAEAAEGSGAAKGALEALGLSAKALSGMSVDEQFLRVADAIKGVSDQGTKLRAAMAIFDTEGVPLVNALSRGRKGLEAYVAEAQKFGLVVSQDAAQAASEFLTNIDKLNKIIEGASITLFESLAPALAESSSKLVRFAELTKDAWEEADELKASSERLASFTGLNDWLSDLGRQLATTMDEAAGLKLIFDGMIASWNLTRASVGFGDYDAALAGVQQHQQDRRDFNFRANRDRWDIAENTIQVSSDPVALVDLTLEDPKKETKTRKQLSELQRLIERLQEQRATLGMTEAQAERYRIETAKGTAADRARALGLFDQIQAWKEADRAIKQAAESSRYIEAINRELDIFGQQKGLEIAGVGMGDRLREQMEEEFAIRQDYAARRRELEEAQAVESTRLEEDQYQARIAALQYAEDEQIRIVEEAAQAKLEAQRDWMNGATKALQNYIDEVNDVAGSMEEAFGKALRGMEDVFVGFVKTGKADFSSLVDSIIEDLARIAYQQMLIAPLAEWLSGGSEGGGGGLGGIIGNLFSGADGGYTGDGGKYEFAGFVHKGEGVLSQEEIGALGGEPGFNALRSALRVGHAAGGMAGRPMLSLPSSSVGAGSNAQGGQNITINMTVNTQDADSFRRSQSQIERQMITSAQRALARA